MVLNSASGKAESGMTYLQPTWCDRSGSSHYRIMCTSASNLSSAWNFVLNAPALFHDIIIMTTSGRVASAAIGPWK